MVDARDWLTHKASRLSFHSAVCLQVPRTKTKQTNKVIPLIFGMSFLNICNWANKSSIISMVLDRYDTVFIFSLGALSSVLPTNPWAWGLLGIYLVKYKHNLTPFDISNQASMSVTLKNLGGKIYVLRAVLKQGPSWNMFHIGMVCRLEKFAFLKHVSDWHRASFVISKSHDKYIVIGI